MTLAGKMALLSVALGGWAIWLGGPWLALGWLAADFACMSVAWHRSDPRLFGKRRDGTRGLASTVALLPYLVSSGAVWHAAQALSRAAPLAVVRPGIWIGRRRAWWETVPSVEAVVDLTCEFTEPVALRGHAGYRCFPILDGGVPSASGLDALLAEIEGVSVFIHCAQGHGRTAMVTAALLLARGVCGEVGDALGMVRAARPGARVSGAQRRFLEEWWAGRRVGVGGARVA